MHFSKKIKLNKILKSNNIKCVYSYTLPTCKQGGKNASCGLW